MALAPAAMVAEMVSPVLPPLAMMGTSGNSSRIFFTMRGVSVLHATFRMEAPASMRERISVSSLVTVMMTGISGQQIQVRDGGVQDHAHRALALDIAGEVQGAHAVGGAAAHTAEHRDVGCLDDGIADGLLRGEGVDREHRVSVAVADDGEVGGEDKTLQPPPVDDDSAGLIDLLRHFQDVMAKAALNVGGSFLFGCHAKTSRSISNLNQIIKKNGL